MSAAAKMRDYRRRRADGRCCLVVEVDEVLLIERLIQAGFLVPEQQDDRVALARALEHTIEVWTRETGNAAAL